MTFKTIRRQIFQVSSCIIFTCMMILSVLPTHGAGVTNDEIFNQANSAFAEKRYSDAARDYESLILRKHYSPEVFFNLGNTYFEQGQIGKSVVNYKRALWLDPNDADIKANLKFVRHQAGFFETDPAWWEEWSHTLSVNGWALLGLWSLALLCLWAALRMFQIKGTYRSIAVILILLTLTSAVCEYLQLQELNQAVVITSEGDLKIAPIDKSPSSAKIPAGSVVQIQKQRDDFYFVTSEDGKAGWISLDVVEKITELPGSS